MKLEVKYLIISLSLDTNFCIYQLPKGLKIRKILAHIITTQKNAQTKARVFSKFQEFSYSYVGSKFNLHFHTEISAVASLTLKSN